MNCVIMVIATLLYQVIYIPCSSNIIFLAINYLRLLFYMMNGVGYMLGSFLTNDENLSDKRVAVRLKLRRINGKLRLFEETYFPYYHIEGSGFESLIDSPVKLSEKDRCKPCRQPVCGCHRLR